MSNYSRRLVLSKKEVRKVKDASTMTRKELGKWEHLKLTSQLQK